MSDPIRGATPLVSAIIPVHNGAAFLAAAIRNVLEQDWSSLEVIVVDDGSTDETASIAAQFGDAIRYAHQARGGPASARNRGIRMARGELLAFLDVDDLWPRGKLRRQAGFLAAHAGVDIVQGLIVRMELDPSAPGPDPAFEECSEPYQFVNLGSAVYRASVFDSVGPFDEALRENEDMDWFIRAWEANVAKVVQDQVALFYRRHAGNMTLEQRHPQLRIVPMLKRHLDRLRSRKITAQTGAGELPAVAAYIGMPPSEKRADRVGPDEFTILSNDCWGSGPYNHAGRIYRTPFIGTRIFAPCYIELLKHSEVLSGVAAHIHPGLALYVHERATRGIPWAISYSPTRRQRRGAFRP